MTEQLGSFDVPLPDSLTGINKSADSMPIKVLLEDGKTVVSIDCSCCKELLSSRLPGGVLIPIASALKTFFERSGMRNLDVEVRGNVMRRIYEGEMEASMVETMASRVKHSVKEFARKRNNT